MRGPTATTDPAGSRATPRLQGGLRAEVVLLTRDSVADLERSLAKVSETTRKASAELLFIDRGSTDGTREYAARRAPGARGIWLGADDSPADALAAAAAASTADVLVLLDPAANLLELDALLDPLVKDHALPGVTPAAPGTVAIRRASLIELLDRQRERFQDGDPLTPLRRHIRAGAARKPTVLHVIEAFDQHAGTGRHVLDLIRLVVGYDHVLAIPSSHLGQSTADAAELAQELGARVERVEMSRSRAPHRHALATAALRRLIQRLRPDVVHGHSSIGGAVARMATIGLSVPVVYTPHAVSRARPALAFERLLHRRTDLLIAVSGSERDYATAHGLADPDHVAVIPPGIELTPPPPLPESLRSRLGISTEVPLIGCVGRLAWQKAPEVFVSACGVVADRLPSAHFVLIGSGPLQTLVEKAIAQTGIEDRFHLVPSIPRADAALGELDIYALPSRFEGSPRTAVEAMRAGVPVVAADADGSRDVVEHWVSGLLVPRDEPYELAAAILTLLKDEALRKRLVRGARSRLYRFDERFMASATATVYSELRERRSEWASSRS